MLLTAVDEQSSPVIEAALRYVNVKAPDPRIARELHRQPGAFGPRADVPRPEVECRGWPPLCSRRTRPRARSSPGVPAWPPRSIQVATLLDRPRPTVRLVTDLQHRGLLRDALGRVARVLLASDRVSEEALTDDIAEAGVTRRPGSGGAVSLPAGRPRRHHRAGSGRAGRRSAENLAVTHDPANHAKIVLSDDQGGDRVVQPAVGGCRASARAVDRGARRGDHVGRSERAVWELFGGSRARRPVEADEANALEQSTLRRSAPRKPGSASSSPRRSRTMDPKRARGAGRTRFRPRPGRAPHFRGHAAELGRIGGGARRAGTAEAGALELVLAEAVAQCNWDLAVLMTRTLGEESPVRSAFVEALADGGGSELERSSRRSSGTTR